MKHGFSLVELSIVLVILGLLVGGVLSGQSLIKAAQLRTVSTEYQKYAGAMNSFRDKYFALPGDLTNATSFWGSAGGTGLATNNGCRTVNSSDTSTCNGNGDGLIGQMAISDYGECYHFWKHLMNAGLVEGTVTGNGSVGALPGTNLPISKFSSSIGWLSAWFAASAASVSSFALPAGNQMTPTSSAISLIFRPEEAWNIDTKLDEGLPQSGALVSYKGTATYPCSSNFGQAPATDATATYNLSSSTVACNIISYFK